MKKNRVYQIITILMSLLIMLNIVTPIKCSAASTYSWPFIDGNGSDGLNADVTQNAQNASLATFNNQLYVAWTETNGGKDAYGKPTSVIRVKKYDGTSWSFVDDGNISYDTTKVSDSPKLIEYKGNLYAIWSETSSMWQIRAKKYDGKAWTPIDGGTGINKNKYANGKAPYVIVYNDELYAIWYETNGGGILQISKYDGSSWKDVNGVDSAKGLNYVPGNTAQNPTAAVCNNKLYISWQENNAAYVPQIRVKSFDGTTWKVEDGNGANGLNIDSTKYAQNSQLITYNNELYAIWQENQIRVKKLDGTTWTLKDGNDAYGLGTGFVPRAAICDNQLYVIYYGNGKMKVSTYDGTTWAYAGGGETTGINKEPNQSAFYGTLATLNGKLYAAWYENNSSGKAQIRVAAMTVTKEIPKSTACDITTWTAPASPAMNGTIATKTVPNGTTSLLVDVAVSANATWKLYSDAVCNTEITNKTMNLNVGANTAYIKVTAEDGTTTKTYTVTITRQAPAATEITSFDAISNVSAGNAGSAVYANASAVIAALPTTVKANGSTVTVPVSTWVDTDSYNPNLAGSYTFTASLGTIPTGYANSGKNTATVEVVVGAPTPTPIVGNVVDDGSGNKVSDISATVTVDSNGNETVSMNAAQAVAMKQPDGKESTVMDLSKITVVATDGSSVSVTEDGQIQVKGLAKDTDNKYQIIYDLGNGNKIAIGTMEIKVSSDGKVSLVSTLIDPYGIITDAATGEAIQGVNVTLYYADTQRNRDNGRTPNTVVSLPGIDGFKPNNNKNPQISDTNGAYGFMVFPNADYYVVAVKDGYDKYVSGTISVNEEIVRHDFKMNKAKAVNQATNQNANSSNTDTKLVQTGNIVDDKVLVAIGLVFMVLGTIIVFKRD